MLDRAGLILLCPVGLPAFKRELLNIFAFVGSSLHDDESDESESKLDGTVGGSVNLQLVLQVQDGNCTAIGGFSPGSPLPTSPGWPGIIFERLQPADKKLRQQSPDRTRTTGSLAAFFGAGAA